MSKNYTDSANIFKALGDENRLKVLELLLNGEKCVNDLLEQVSIGQSTLSHHLKMMCVAGIIKSKKSGTATFYSINPDGAQNAVELLAELTGINIKQKNHQTVALPVIEAVDDEELKVKKETPVKQKGSRPNGWLL